MCPYADNELPEEILPWLGVASAALEAWPVGRPALTFLRASENLTFRVEGDEGACYLLRLHHSLVQRPASVARDRASITSELRWLQALARGTAVRVQQPVEGAGGALVVGVPIAGRQEEVCCSLLRWLKGDEFRQDDAGAPGRMDALGVLAAALHAHAATWQVPAGFTRPAYDSGSVERSLATILSSLPTDILGADDRRAIEGAAARIAACMGALGRRRDAWGIIHADLQGSNLLVHGSEVRPIDFSLCGFGHYLLDMGCTIAWLKPPLRRLFLAAYRARRPRPDAAIPQVEALARYAIVSCFVFCAADPAHRDWLVRRAPEVARTYCRSLLAGERFLLE